MDKRSWKELRTRRSKRMSNRRMGEALGWVGTVVCGAWLAVWTARCITATTEWVVTAAEANRPVRAMVEDALVGQPAGDTVMAEAFEEALEGEASEERAAAVS
jgi:hypothetical protein